MFTVKRVPSPIPTFNKGKDKASVNALRQEGKPYSKMPEWFVFKGIKYKTKKFDVELLGIGANSVKKTYRGISNMSEAKQLSRLLKGDKVIIKNIEVRQDGQSKNRPLDHTFVITID